MNINIKFIDDLYENKEIFMRSYSLGGSLNAGLGRAILPPTTNRLSPQHGSIKINEHEKE